MEVPVSFGIRSPKGNCQADTDAHINLTGLGVIDIQEVLWLGDEENFKPMESLHSQLGDLTIEETHADESRSKEPAERGKTARSTRPMEGVELEKSDPKSESEDEGVAA